MTRKRAVTDYLHDILALMRQPLFQALVYRERLPRETVADIVARLDIQKLR